MFLSKIGEIFSAAVGHLSSTKSTPVAYSSPGLPFVTSSAHRYGFTGSGHKHSLRLSSSLQDFSTYRQLDQEEGNLDPRNDRSSIHAKPPLRENGGSSFSKVKAPPSTPFPQRKWLLVIFLLFFLLGFAFLAYLLQYFYASWSQGASKFYIVLDCGSTGTRVYLYQASVKHEKDGSLPILLRSLPGGLLRKPNSQSGRAYNRMETEPGFDKLVHNASGLRGAIKPLLQWAETQIPKHAHKTTSLFLYATAGVRRLPSSDSEWLLNNAWSILATSPFLCRKEWVKIISGMEEAYYGWIALNYHSGVLGAVPKKETYGALDLGGSSLQVTFESKEHVHLETSLDLSIGPVSHHLSAYSLSGYGLNDAFDKSVVHLLRGLPQITKADLTSGKVEIKHPCLHAGYKEQYICAQCASVKLGGGGLATGGKVILAKGGKPGVPIQLVGDPKWDQCSALAKLAVNLSEWTNLSPGIDCELRPCALAANLPRPYGHFYAMSGFFVVYRFFNLTPDAALDDVLEKGQEFCEKTWDIAKNSVPPQPFIEQYCFRAPYIVSLLREGLHITDSNVSIGSGSMTWTLGVALVEAGKAFSSRVELPNPEILHIKINLIVLLIFLIFSLLLLACALSFVGNWMPRFSRRPVLPLFRHNSASRISVLSIPSLFSFRRWSPVSSGDGKPKMPLSPIASAQERPFGTRHGFGGNIGLTESSLYPSSSGVAHSYSSGSLGQNQFDNSSIGSLWTAHRSQMCLQSRRSQSREDLNSSLADVHLVKV